MTQPERNAEQPEPDADAEVESAFLAGIEFLTGEDPNLGSFLLVVGMVTVVFISLFQVALPPPISYLLTAGVLFITVLSAVFASLLDSLGYFGHDPTTAASESDDDTATGRPWVPVDKPSAPLPPLINFDAELRAYADMFDGDLPAEFDPFIDDYLRLKTNTGNRATIASDLRADLNPIGTLSEEGSEGDRIYEDVSQRLFRYIGNENGHLTLERVAFYDEDGDETDIEALRDQIGRVEIAIANEGERADVEAVVTLYDEDDDVIASRTCTAGSVSPGAAKVLNADIFVPVDTERATTTVRASDSDRPFAGA